MIKITPFYKNVLLKPILFSGLDFVFNPNENLVIKTINPFELFISLSNQGLNWQIDASEVNEDELPAVKIWNDFSFTTRVSRAITIGKPIILFGETILTEDIKKEDKSNLAIDIIEKIKEKKYAAIVEDSETLKTR